MLASTVPCTCDSCLFWSAMSDVESYNRL